MKHLFSLLLLLAGFQFANAQCPQTVAVTNSHCTTFSDTVDARVLKSRLCSDSITIVFNAAGTALAGDTNVYFHSGPEFSPFTGWQLPYTVGHFNANDGIGRMRSLGNNRWSITIQPRTYYNFSVDSCLNGIFMVFRNYNGSVEVKDNGNDIYLYTAPTVPTSTYANIQGTRTTSAVTYSWSDGHTDSVRIFTTGGNYTVTATSVGGCTATGTVGIRTAHAPVSLGADIHRCDTVGVILNAGAGFTGYKWLDEGFSTNATHIARKPGFYWVQTLDSANCPSLDTIQVTSTETRYLSVVDSVLSCPGHTVSVDASTNITLNGDSIVIVYDATQGQTGLVGDTNVYFYSGPEFRAFQGWQTNYTVGHFNSNDGIGRMTSLGNNKWRIAIEPYTYYHINPDSALNGLFMVFRNFNGTKTGKDATGQDIFLLLGHPPTAAFTGVTASHKSGPVNYAWSNGNTTAVASITTAGTYYVTATDNYNCSKTDSVKVFFNGSYTASIGNDTTVCRGASATFRAPAGYASYTWSNGSHADTLVVTVAGTYSVTALDNGGCQYTATRKLFNSARQVSLGPDVTRCTPTTTVLSGGTGFVSFKWLDGAVGTAITYNAVKPGNYWVRAIDSIGCSSFDTVTIKNSDVANLSIPDSVFTCAGHSALVDASVNISQHGDSLVIIYDATQGQSTLAGDTNVYFHSGPEFRPFTGWQLPYTVGSFTQNDGIGRMTSLGANKWRIAIDPYTYYNINPDTSLNGIFMVFRNFNGTKTGKDAAGNDIFLSWGTQPISAFSGVTGSRKSGAVSYSWSNGFTTALDSFSTAGLYSVTVTDGHSCSKSDTVRLVINNNLALNLGNDTAICAGQSIVFRAPAGYTGFTWSTGSHLDSIVVNTAGTYTLSAQDSSGCLHTGSRKLTVSNTHVSLGNDTTLCALGNLTLNATAGFASYKWLDGTAGTSRTYTARNAGHYWIKATDSVGCISYDTVAVHYSNVTSLNLADTLQGCPGTTISLDASTLVEQKGDSLVIIYDATKGQTGLVGASKVYFHSGPEFHAFQGWQTAYTVGHFNLDDGIGKMDSLGGNKWRIAIDPYSYYNINPDSSLNGIFMVFRNFNGTATGKDAAGNDIFLSLTGTLPSSTFNGIVAFRKSPSGILYHWSNGSTAPTLAVTASGNYSVTAVDGRGCSKSDTVVVRLNSNLNVNILGSTFLCQSDTLTLTLNAVFPHYAWSTGDTTASIKATHGGNYSVTVTSGNCSASDTTTITLSAHQVSIGNDIIRCNAGTRDTLTASAGFVSYKWFTDTTSSRTHIAVNPGCYWVAAKDSAGCISHDTISIHNSAVLGLNLADSATLCPGDTARTDASVSINAVGDSVVIVYDATQGQTGLVGAAKVYIHSGPEFQQNQGWVGSYTVGHYGQDDGVGQMTSLGNNKWRIAIDPYCYYSINPDTSLRGIFMIFRNADGSQTGKDAAGNNIYVGLYTSPPTSAFTGVVATRKAMGPLTYTWSNGGTNATGHFTSGGSYTVTVSDGHGCSKSDTVRVVTGISTAVNLGPDTVVCTGRPLVLNAGAGFSSYHWNTNVTIATITVTTVGIYSVTVTNSSGCTGKDTVVVTSCSTSGCTAPTAKFHVQNITPFNQVTFIDSSVHHAHATYLWHFGDGTTGTDTTSTAHTYAARGSYIACLKVTDSCGADSACRAVAVNITGIDNVNFLNSVNVYPNPTNNIAHIEVSAATATSMVCNLRNILGELISTNKMELIQGTSTLDINVGNLAQGIYSIELTDGNERVFRKLIVTK